MKVYLDNCCFNRPYDNQVNLLVVLETEAKLFIQGLIHSGKLELVWSFMLDYENKDNPFDERRSNIAVWKRLSTVDCDLCGEITGTAKKLVKVGLRHKDASHIACAIYAEADFFITTDKGILNKKIPGIHVVNPMDFIRRYLND
jgi:hypothetical protein